MKNILFLTNLSTPYRVDFFNELGKISNLTVLFEARRAREFTFNWNEDSISNFEAVFLSAKPLSPKRVNFSAFRYLKRDKYDAIVIACYSTITAMLAIIYMKLMRIPYCLETDGGIVAEKESWLVKKIKTFFIGGAEKYFSPSEGSDEYLKYYGASGNVHRYPFTSLGAKDILNDPVSDDLKKFIRQELNIKEKTVVLAIGQFIYRKGFDILIKSCERLDNKVGIYIIGGKPTEEYISLLSSLNIKNIKFKDFMNKDEVKKWMMASDIFVLPTREDIWGLVINEAMSFGLPVVTTDRCVAGLELIEDLECIIPINDAVSLSNAINHIINDEGYRSKVGLNNLKNIKKSTFENMAISHITNI